MFMTAPRRKPVPRHVSSFAGGMDAEFVRPKGAAQGVDDLPMFARTEGAVSVPVSASRDRGKNENQCVPDIRSPAPSVPFGSSEEAADRLSFDVRAKQNGTILLTLAALDRGDCLSRSEISERTGIPIHVLCARLKLDLQPVYVECVERARPSHVKPGLAVNGYRLTEAGQRRASGGEV